MKETRFKQTDIGPIPHDWEVVTLGDCLTSIRTGLNPRSFFVLNPPKAQNYYVTIREFKGGKLVLSEATDRINDTALQLCNNRSHLQKNDVLFSGTGTIGEVYWVKEHPTNWDIKEGVYALKSNTQCINPAFLSYILQEENTKERLLSLSTGSTIKSVPMIKLEEFNISVPPVEEQRRIAEALGDVDALIGELERLVEKKRLVKQGAMQQLLTGRRRLPGFSAPWKTVRLADIGTFSKGKGISRSEAQTGSIPAIRYGEIYTCHNDYIKHFTSHISNEVARTSVKLEYGQILFTCSGETKEDIAKAVAFVGHEEAYVGGDIIILTPTVECDPFSWASFVTPGLSTHKKVRQHKAMLLCTFQRTQFVTYKSAFLLSQSSGR